MRALARTNAQRAKILQKHVRRYTVRIAVRAALKYMKSRSTIRIAFIAHEFAIGWYEERLLGGNQNCTVSAPISCPQNMNSRIINHLRPGPCLLGAVLSSLAGAVPPRGPLPNVYRIFTNFRARHRAL
jgi:hypothetical protein